MQMVVVAPAGLDLALRRLRQVPEPAVVAMAASLRSKGQLSALVAARAGQALVLVDGFVRQAAALRLGWAELRVEALELSAVQMKAQLYLRHRQRELLLVEQCRLVAELHHGDGLSGVQIGELLERHKSWVSRRLTLHRELSPQLLEDLSVGLLGGGALRRLARLPARNQEELVAVARRHRLGPADTAALVELWRRAGEAEVRRYLTEDPRGALRQARGQPDQGEGQRLTGGAWQLVRALRAVRLLSRRVVGQLETGLGQVPAEAVSLVATSASDAEQDCRRAIEGVNRWVGQQQGAER
jgi:ParB-like chromosome segregation protein Spo0J